MNEILLRIRQTRNEMTKKEGIVADALLNEPSAVITRTITAYGQYISSSTATITRFCRKLGISGYSELKISIAKSLSSDSSEVDSIAENLTLNDKSSSSEIVSSVIANAQSAITKLHRLSNVKKLEELFLNLNSKAYDEDKSFIKAGHILACYFFDTYPSIIDVLLEIEKNKNIVNFLEIHEYLEFLAKYVILCGRYINDIFSINDIVIK